MTFTIEMRNAINSCFFIKKTKDERFPYEGILLKKSSPESKQFYCCYTSNPHKSIHDAIDILIRINFYKTEIVIYSLNMFL